MLRLAEVSKRYGWGRWVLQDVDLDIPAGQVVAINGANGSGKSTLLRLLIGLTRPTSGTVSGRPAVIGYVPDRFPPHERLSATAYLTHLGRIRGLPTRVATARADELMDRLDLVGGKDSPLRTLSKGNAQKIALAQALLIPPQLLVLDEPWSGLDVAAHGVLAGIITEVARGGGSVVFADHRVSITEAHASQAYAISAGQVTRYGMEHTQEGQQVTEVVLVARSGVDGARANSASDVDWYANDGVILVANGPESITIRVAREHSDALLLTALRNGWSVKEVVGEPMVTSKRNAR
ncbi:MAG: ABC transporter ATP-binding protein [Pseudonocardiaceae bacterium]